MKVSLINLNLVAEDAIGQCILNQARFFRRRGDDVQIYVLHAPQHVPADVEKVANVVSLGDLIGGRKEHFDSSDLYIYHYPGYYRLMESIRGVDRGVVIFYYHNVTPPDLWGSDTDRAALMQGIEGRALVHYADLCITPSPFNKQDLVDDVGYAADRIYVLPLAVPLEHFTPGEKPPDLVQQYGLEGQKVLLFVGRMAGNKRIDLLVEALAAVKEETPHTKLLLVGDDRSSPAYRDVVTNTRGLAHRLGVDKDVIWTGSVDALPPYLRLADVYVTASLHEGFGVPLIEAMACGVPVVASRSGAMPWVMGEAGLLFEPGDSIDLATQIKLLQQDTNLYQALVERGLARVQDFGLDQYEAGLADIVDSAMVYALPGASRDQATEVQEPTDRPQAPTTRGETILNLLASELAGQSDIALRDYQVRSRAPLVGPLIVWVRRNLTSHLREPYLDPMVENQVDLNRQVAEWMRRAAILLSDSARRQIELEAQVKALEAQVEALRSRQNGTVARKEQ